MKTPNYIHIILHHWPDNGTYTVMPTGFANKSKAQAAAARYMKMDNGHRYTIKTIEVNHD